MTVRLFLDGGRELWAVARCEVCTIVNKYPAFPAVQSGLVCKRCGHAMDVRRQLLSDAAARSDIPRDLVDKLSEAASPTP